MKILLISNGFPPRHWAGTETYTATIGRELRRRGKQVYVLCGGDWEVGPHPFNGATDEEHEGIFVRRLNLNWMRAPDPFLYLYNNPIISDYLAGYLQQLKPDLVHVTSCERLSASVLHAAKKAGFPLVLSLTDFWFLCPRINLLRSDGRNCDGRTTTWNCLECQARHTKAYRWSRRVLPDPKVSQFFTAISQFPLLTRQRGLRGLVGDVGDRKRYLQQALTWPDYRITASQFVRDTFEANGVAAPIEVRPYGHDLSWLASYSGKKDSSVTRLGFIGQITKEKGLDLLLRSLRLLEADLGDKFSLTVYGSLKKDQEYTKLLLELAADIPNIRFAGLYRHESTARVFENIDVLIVPSLWYDFPLIIYEAFAARTPVIATRLGGMAEAVHDEVDGLLFKCNDSVDLARQLRRVIGNGEMLKRLQDNVPPVRTSREEVEELESIYLGAVSASMVRDS